MKYEDDRALQVRVLLLDANPSTGSGQALGRGRLGQGHPITGYHPLQMLRKYSYPSCTFVILTRPYGALLWSKRPPRRPLRTCVLTLPKGRGIVHLQSETTGSQQKTGRWATAN